MKNEQKFEAIDGLKKKEIKILILSLIFFLILPSLVEAKTKVEWYNEGLEGWKIRRSNQSI